MWGQFSVFPPIVRSQLVNCWYRVKRPAVAYVAFYCKQQHITQWHTFYDVICNIVWLSCSMPQWTTFWYCISKCAQDSNNNCCNGHYQQTPHNTDNLFWYNIFLSRFQVILFYKVLYLYTGCPPNLSPVVELIHFFKWSISYSQ